MPETADRVYGYLGLAVRGGNLAGGEFAVSEAIRTRRAKLVIIAEDASDNTAEKAVNQCTYYNIPYRRFGTKDALGNRTGKASRALLAVLDGKMAAHIDALLSGSDRE